MPHQSLLIKAKIATLKITGGNPKFPWLGVLNLGLIGLCLSITTAPLVLAQTGAPGPNQPGSATPSPAVELKTLLVGASQPQLLLRPGDDRLTYLTISPAYGVVAGSETGYTPLGSTITPQKLGTASATFDEAGSLYTVWSQQSETDQSYQLYSNLLTRDGKTGKVGRLTVEGQTGSSLVKPKLAYSVAQHTLFLLYVEKGQPTDSLWVISSADRGLSWSRPLALGLTLSTNERDTALITDSNGNPHVFFVVAGRDDSKVQLLHRFRLGQNWSPPVGISQEQYTQLKYLEATATASGEVWVSWLSEQGLRIARRDHNTAHWQNWPIVSFAVAPTPNTQIVWSTLVVGEDGQSAGLGWLAQSKTETGTTASQLKYVQTNNGGKTWQSSLTLLNLEERGLCCPTGLSAILKDEAVEVGLTANSRDYHNEPTLYLLELREAAVVAATPTPLPPTSTAMMTSTIAADTPTPEASPTATATSLPTLTPAPTATTGSSSPIPNGSGNTGSGQGGNQPSHSTPTSRSTVETSVTTPPGTTMDPAIATATAYAAIQNEAARTPIIIAVPTQNFTAQGPLVLPPTPTPIPPTATALPPTPTALPTATPVPPSPTAVPPTATASPTPKTSAVPAYTSYYPYSNGNGNGFPLLSVMLSLAGILLVGKGLLNFKFNPKAKARTRAKKSQGESNPATTTSTKEGLASKSSNLNERN